MFTEEELAYLGTQGMARLATVSADGQPGESVAKTRKFRNVRAGNAKVALVIDDLVSFDPFVARQMRVYGLAAESSDLPGQYLRIIPTTSWSWNLAGEPVGENWYEAHRTEH